MAYAVATMVEILERYQHHLDLEFKNQTESLLEKARPLRDILFRYPCFNAFQYEFIDAAHKAEDVIEARVRNQILLLPPEQNDFELDLTNLVQEFKSLVIHVLGLLKSNPEIPFFLPQCHVTSKKVPWYTSLDPYTKNDVTSIFQDDFQTLKAKLIEGPSKLRIITIDGKAGMGKRTLARRLAWVTSPLEIHEKSCLLNLLEGLGKLTNDLYQKDVDKLKVYIKDVLKHIKYFIVIHDVFGDKNLVTFTRLFRDYGVGARVLYTTEGFDEETLSTYAEPYHMRLLTNTESWHLLRRKVFGRGNCPSKLKPIGKNIAQLCNGIPQVISLVGGVLATSQKTPVVWKFVATTLGSLLERDVDIKLIQYVLLSLIYMHLPYYLRPCLIYIGAFYESRVIKASKIVKLWIAEGFVKQSAGECIEDVAETYLRILIDKNLLSLIHEEPNGRLKAFQPHKLLRMNYWSIATEEKFLGSKFMHEHLGAGNENLGRRVSAHRFSQPINETELPLFARSFLSVSGALRWQVSMYLKLRMLRVLEVFQLEFYQFPKEILGMVLLRYLALSCFSNLPNLFSLLKYLQTLIIRRLSAFRAFTLPADLWGLMQLRHVKCKETFVLIYPKTGNEVVHENLQTLSDMQLVGVRNRFLKQIPSIKNLGICCNIAMVIVFDLTRLEKLETLKCSTDWSLASRNFLFFLTLPRSLRKLTLSLCRIPSEFMKLIGSLPNLELFKLQKSDFVGVGLAQNKPEWETAEGEFPQLLSLEMLDLNLVQWRTKANHLPRLKHLVIRNCFAMVEIPLDIGNIRTLELIQVNETSPSALVSAMQIKKRQEGRKNSLLQIRTHKVV